jgi:hypothetical protein
MSKRPDADFGIGLYGIGMKRAMFKMGKKIEVQSSTTKESFTAFIDVPAWLNNDKTWDFELEPAGPKKRGTAILITSLHGKSSGVS